jgi:hypothetical protein
MPLPDVHFGKADSKPLDWRKYKDDSLDDDELLVETPQSIVAMLGFDPLDGGELDLPNDGESSAADAAAMDAEFVESEHPREGNGQFGSGSGGSSFEVGSEYQNSLRNVPHAEAIAESEKRHRAKNAEQGRIGTVANKLLDRGYVQLSPAVSNYNSYGKGTDYARFRAPSGYEFEVRLGDHPAAPNNPALDVGGDTDKDVDRLVEAVKRNQESIKQGQEKYASEAVRTENAKSAWEKMPEDERAQVYKAAGLPVGKKGAKWLDPDSAFGKKFRAALVKHVER